MKINFETPVNVNCDGSGLWTGFSGPIPVTGYAFVNNVDPDELYELRVYFDYPDFVEEYGLIYTDELFLRELKEQFANLERFQGLDFEYSEQGMQGDDYVSFDIWTKDS